MLTFNAGYRRKSLGQTIAAVCVAIGLMACGSGQQDAHADEAQIRRFCQMQGPQSLAATRRMSALNAVPVSGRVLLVPKGIVLKATGDRVMTPMSRGFPGSVLAYSLHRQADRERHQSSTWKVETTLSAVDGRGAVTQTIATQVRLIDPTRLKGARFPITSPLKRGFTGSRLR